MKTVSSYPTFKGWPSYVGMALLVAAFGGAVQELYWMLALIVPGVILFPSFRGIQLDAGKKRYREIRDFKLFGIGEWKDFGKHSHLMLTPFRNAQVMSSRGSSSTIRTKTFDVVLTSPDEQDTVLIREFTDPNKAETFYNSIKEYLNVPSINKMEQMRDVRMKKK